MLSKKYVLSIIWQTIRSSWERSIHWKVWFVKTVFYRYFFKEATLNMVFHQFYLDLPSNQDSPFAFPISSAYSYCHFCESWYWKINKQIKVGVFFEHQNMHKWLKEWYRQLILMEDSQAGLNCLEVALQNIFPVLSRFFSFLMEFY